MFVQGPLTPPGQGIKTGAVKPQNQTQSSQASTSTQTAAPIKTPPKPPMITLTAADGKKSLLSPESEATLKVQIETFDSSKLKHNAQHTPSPKFMEQARAMSLDLNAKPAPGALARANDAYIGEVIGDAMLGTQINSNNQAQFQRVDASSLQSRIIRPGSMSALLGNHFNRYEQDLRSRLVRTGKVTDQAEQKAVQIANQISPDNEMLVKINSMSDNELRDEVAAHVGNLRANRYGGQGYAQLSDKKQQLVDSIVAGLRQGAAERSADAPDALRDQAVRVMTQELNGIAANSDKAVAWTLKSRNEMEQDFAVAQGWTTPQNLARSLHQAEMQGLANPESVWKSNLTPFQQEVLTSVSEGLSTVLDRQIPNRAQGMQTLQGTSKGVTSDYQVPSAFSLNGVNYDSPRYLGKGGVGLIMEYSNPADRNDKVVVKSLLEPEKRAEMAREIIAHRHVLGGANPQPHDNIVNLRGIFKGPGDGLFMVMDKAEGGDLQTLSNSLGYMAREMGLPQSARGVLSQYYMREAAQGMQALQDKGVMHNDAKGLNFLMHEGRVMVSDFGSTHTQTTMSRAERPDTTYASSEWDQAQVTQKNDMYALGVMLHMINGGNPPGFNPLGPGSDTVSAYGRLKNSLLATDSADRISPQGILDSAYVKNLDNLPKHLVTDLVKAAEDFGRSVGGKLDDINSEMAGAQANLDDVKARIAASQTNGQAPSAQELTQRTAAEQQIGQLVHQRALLLAEPAVMQAYDKLMDAAKALEARMSA